MVKVKVCGITNKTDAFMAAEMGADALGFIFAPSPRKILPEEARKIIQRLPPFVQTVGVFVNEVPRKMLELMEFCGLDLLQLHGDESPDMCEALMPRCIKAIRVRPGSHLDEIVTYKGKVRAVLLDTYVEGKKGGTGSTFDWTLAAKGGKTGIPLILAGGLDPSNIEEAVLTVNPLAVDVNSGIEQSPGKKSPLLMEKLMAKVGEVNRKGMKDE